MRTEETPSEDNPILRVINRRIPSIFLNPQGPTQPHPYPEHVDARLKLRRRAIMLYDNYTEIKAADVTSDNGPPHPNILNLLERYNSGELYGQWIYLIPSGDVSSVCSSRLDHETFKQNFGKERKSNLSMDWRTAIPNKWDYFCSIEQCALDFEEFQRLEQKYISKKTPRSS